MKDRGYCALGYAVWHGRKLARRRRRRADVRRKILAAAIVALVVVGGALADELTESA
jgi:hypothetical protein